MASGDIEKLANVQISRILKTSLSAVNSATDGTIVDVGMLKTIEVFINISVNTGAVTIAIETSPTGTFGGEEVARETFTKTATTGTLEFNYAETAKFIRVTTATQSDSTVTATVSGRT